MRSKYPLLVLIVLIVSGFLAFQRFQAGQRSPFPLGMAAAGMRYQELVDAEDRGEKLNLHCDTIASGYRICDADTDGPRGKIISAVNEKGRIAVLQMRFDDTSYRMRDLTSTMAASWDSIAPRTTTTVSGGGDVLRWKSPDRRWSVQMTMRSSVPTPEWVVMRDEGGVARMDQQSLPALLVLAAEGFVPASALDSAEQRAPGSLGRAADTLSASGRAAADLAGKLPLCAPEPTLLMTPGTTSRETLGEAMAPLAEASIALAFPGKRLVLGEVPYLVDTAGAAEQIAITPLAGDGYGTSYVFAVSFEGRTAAVVAAAKQFNVSGQCRAPAELIVAHVDSATDQVTGVEHAPIEQEALSSQVHYAQFWTGSDGKPAAKLGYAATYGTIDYFGTVEWLAIMPLDSMKLRTRLPLELNKQDAADNAVLAGFEHLDADGSDGEPCDDPPSNEALAGRRVALETLRKQHNRAETMVLPSPVKGLTSGWAILSLIRTR